MKIYYPKDKNGNEIGFRTPESYVFDTAGKSLTDKIAQLNSKIVEVSGFEVKNGTLTIPLLRSDYINGTLILN